MQEQQQQNIARPTRPAPREWRLPKSQHLRADASGVEVNVIYGRFNCAANGCPDGGNRESNTYARCHAYPNQFDDVDKARDLMRAVNADPARYAIFVLDRNCGSPLFGVKDGTRTAPSHEKAVFVEWPRPGINQLTAETVL